MRVDRFKMSLVLITVGLRLGDVASAQSVLYVEDDAPPGGNGTSWATAFTYLQDALATATPGDEIRVAGGTYTPDRDEAGRQTPGYRGSAFVLINGLAVRGGYRGCPGGDCNSGDPNDRALVSFKSIMSGDLLGNDNEVALPDVFLDDPSRDDNSNHVVGALYLDGTAVLDGFTITAGNADGLDSPDSMGGGMYNTSGSPTVTNCIFSRNAAYWGGGGMANTEGSPTVTNCIFRRNYAEIGGGGMYNERNSSPTVVNCVFTGNATGFPGWGGGGMHNAFRSNPTVTNCTFSRNVAPLWW